MSRKVAIVCDSTGSLSEEILKEYQIFTSYLMVVFGEDAYQEFKELSLEKFIELTNASEELPTTSQPSVGANVEIYKKIFEEGYEEIIHVTLASSLSGSYDSACSAAKMVDAKNIHVFDSKAVLFPQGGLAVEAAKLSNAGKSAAEILAVLEKLQKHVHLSVAVADLTNLKKGGRISNIQASLGNVLQLKPILSLMPTGKVEAAGRVRTFKKAIQFLVDVAKNANLDENYEIGILHAENPEGAQLLKAELQKIYPNINMRELELSLVIATHSGAGAVAVTWLKKQSG